MNALEQAFHQNKYQFHDNANSQTAISHNRLGIFRLAALEIELKG